MNPDVRVYWTATALYGLAALFYILAFIRKKEKFADLGMNFVWVGFIVHALGTFYPAITHKYTHICSFYKVIGGTIVMGMFVFLAASLAKKAIKPAGLLIMPISFGLMVLGGLMPCHPLGPSPVYKGWQLWGHVTGAGFNFGFALLAAAMGVLYLLKEAKGKTGYPYDQLPDLEVLDRLNYRFVLVAFIFASTMVCFGSLWSFMKFGMVKKTLMLAGIVWGFWSIYAFALASRWFFHWQGRRLALYSPFALLLVFLFLFYMAPFREKNYHSGPFFSPYNLQENMKPYMKDIESTTKPDKAIDHSGPVSTPPKVDKVAKLMENKK